MGGFVNLCRVVGPRIYSNVLIKNNGTKFDTCLHKNYIFNCSNQLFSISNSVRWVYQISRFCTTSKESHSPREKASAASQIAQELLAAKIKDERKQDGTSSQSDADADEKQRLEEQDRARRALRFSFIAFGVIIAGVGTTLIFRWGSPPVDEEGRTVEDDLSQLPLVEQYLRRTYREMREMNKMIQEPSRDQLLPDPLAEPYIQPPYTLVLELRDVLVHPEWTYQTGWRFKKRPGVDFLLQHCAPPLFEIVIYTNEQGFTAFPVIDKLDPNGFIWYRLFKDSTRYVDGKHVKELNCLNRDLRKVIMVDWDGAAISCRRNQLQVPRWDGKMSDKGLMQLAQMLRTIAESEVADVREVLDYYRQFNDPLETFSELQRQALEAEQRQQEEREALAKHEGPKTAAHWKPSFVRKWL